MTITAHCLVRDEENFIWYAIQSVLPFMDKILVWDTGSTDKTVEIIKSITSSKIEFQEKGLVNEMEHTKLRNDMVNKTTTDWFMVLDGDEIWPENQLKNTIMSMEQLPGDKNVIVSRFIFNVGDVYHYSSWGKYNYPWGLSGHYSPRLFRNAHGIHFGGNYDHDTAIYQDNTLAVTEKNCFVSPDYFFHCGVLVRSPRDNEVTLGHGRRSVSTYSLGILGHGMKLPNDVDVPEVFASQICPAIVPKVRPLSKRQSLTNLGNYLADRLNVWD